MDKLRIGVIGTGIMGQNHVRNLINEHAFFDMVGIYDANLERADKIAAQYDTKAFRSMDDLLDRVEAVSIVVPSSLHKEVGLKAAKHSVHALIEKPLATNVRDAEEIVAAFESAGLKLQVGHIERFNPVIIELNKIIEKRSVFYLEAHRYSPFANGGRITDTSVVEDLLIHDMDLICHLMEPNKVTDIQAIGEKIRSSSIDFATCLLDFGGQAHAVIDASRVSQSKERTISIHTEDGVILADLLTRSLSITKNTNLTIDSRNSDIYVQDGIIQRIFVPNGEPLRAELIAFAKAIKDGGNIEVDGNVGVKAIALCEEVNAKIRERGSKK